MVNYGIAYGLSAFGLADRLSIPREEAGAYIERYFERFAGVKRFIDETIERAERGGQRDDADGPPPADPRAARPALADAARSASDSPSTRSIQGTAADIIKLAMIRSEAARSRAGLESRLILQIHDELLFEGPEGEIEAVGGARPPRDGRRLRARPAAGRDSVGGADWLSAK